MKRFLPLLLAAVAISCSKPSKAETVSPTAFRDAVAAEISKRDPSLCVEKPDSSTIRIGRPHHPCNEAVLSTSYVYQQYLGEPGQLQALVSGLAATASSAVQAIDQKTFQPDPARLVVLVRPAAYAGSMRSDSGKSVGLWRNFVGDLIAVLMQENGDQSRSISLAELKAAHLTESQAWDLALRNVRARIGPLDRTTNDQGAQVVTAKSGLATSNLLFPETCRSGGPSFDAFLVTRDTYFYADQNVQKATSMLASYAAQLIQSGEETYSSRLISCLGGRWYASKFDGANAWRPVADGSQ